MSNFKLLVQWLGYQPDSREMDQFYRYVISYTSMAPAKISVWDLRSYWETFNEMLKNVEKVIDECQEDE